MLIKTVYFLIIIVFMSANAANILGVFPLPAVSHHILASKLMKGLAEAGHDVTMITPFRLKDLPKNGTYTEIFMDGFREEFEDHLNIYCNLSRPEALNSIQSIMDLRDKIVKISNLTFHHPHVDKLLKSDIKFDVLIMEQFGNDGLKVFAHLFDCPLITLSIFGPNPWVNPTVGNPQQISYVPHTLLSNFSKDSTLDRAKNMIIHILDYISTNYITLPRYEKLVNQAFPNAPKMHDLFTNVSLVLLNSHISIFPAIPLVPNMVEIGGYFIDPPKKLPKDIQEFLDSAKDGAIYFSMGSNLGSKDLPDEKKIIIVNVLKKLKQKVLWKFEEDLPGKPSNIMIRKWLPQQDILGHPNIELFITHGGLLSITEAIHHGVPILAIPVFGDQPTNANRVVAGGYGLKLDYVDPNFSEEKFAYLVNELLNNTRYKEKVQMRSKIYHDRPQRPMETAIFWTEYVIRHKGAPHLRVAGRSLPWYKYFMVDVIGALIFSILITFLSLKIVLKKVCGLIEKCLFKRGKVKAN